MNVNQGQIEPTKGRTNASTSHNYHATSGGQPTTPAQSTHYGQLYIPTKPKAVRLEGSSSFTQNQNLTMFSSATSYTPNTSTNYSSATGYSSNTSYGIGQASYQGVQIYNQPAPHFQQPHNGYSQSPYVHGPSLFGYGNHSTGNQGYLGPSGSLDLPRPYPPQHPTYAPPGLGYNAFAAASPSLYYGNIHTAPPQTPSAPKRGKRRVVKKHERQYKSGPTSNGPGQAAPQHRTSSATMQEQSPATENTHGAGTEPLQGRQVPNPGRTKSAPRRLVDEAAAGNPWGLTMDHLEAGLIVQIKPNAHAWSGHPGVVLDWDDDRRIRVIQITGFGAGNRTVRERFGHIANERHAEYLCKAYLLIADAQRTETHCGCPVLAIRPDGAFLPKRSYVNCHVVKTLNLNQLMLFTAESGFVRRCLTAESLEVLREYREGVAELLARQKLEEKMRRGQVKFREHEKHLEQQQQQQQQQRMVMQGSWQGRQWQPQENYWGTQPY